MKLLKLQGNPIPRTLLNRLGGIDKFGKAKKPQKFVEYCQSKSPTEVESIKLKRKTYEVINSELYLKDKGIRTLSELKGLEGLKTLKVLDLSENFISNLKELGSLTSLEVLNLQDNCIEDMSGIEKLKNLKTLRLHGNGIYEVDELNKLKNLKIIDLDSKRKMDDVEYLKCLLNSLLIKEIKPICRAFKMTNYSKLTKDRLINHFGDTLRQEEIRDCIRKIESEIINNSFEEALKRIQRNRIVISKPKKHEVEVYYRSSKTSFRHVISMAQKIIENPVRKCNCKVGTGGGFCEHFWAGFIFSLKKGFFKLSDWTLTPIPENFEEKVKNINIKVNKLGVYSLIKPTEKKT